jgi:uncharacterized protein (TIRG00374 family)
VRRGSSGLRPLIGAAISIIALAGCVWWAGRQDIPAVPTDAEHLADLAGALGVYALTTFARGWRWDHILGYLKVSHRPLDAYALTVVGMMGNTVLPARGGEFLRMFLMADRSEARRREILGSIVTERLLDVGALGVLFIGVTLAGVAGAPPGKLAAWLAGLTLVLLIAAAYAYLRARRAGRLQGFADRIRPVARASRLILTSRGLLLGVVTVGCWSLDGVTMHLCARAFDVALPVDAAIAVVVLASLGAMIPAGPGAIGTYDAAALYALGRAGVANGPAVGCLLIFRAVVFIPITVLGLLLMVVRYGGLRDALRRGREEEREASEPPLARGQAPT